MVEPDIRDWPFAKKTLYELKQEQRAKKKADHRHHWHHQIFWVQVEFTSTHQIANYQLPRDLQAAMNQHRQQHAHENWKSVLLGALINVPISSYHNGIAKIKPARVVRLLILPVRTHDSRWITRSQFVQLTYHWWQWLLGLVQLSQEATFLTHDFDDDNQQRIRMTVANFRRELIQTYRRHFLKQSAKWLLAILVIILLSTWL